MGMEVLSDLVLQLNYWGGMHNVSNKIWILWDKDASAHPVVDSAQLLVVSSSVQSILSPFLFSSVYAKCDNVERRCLWQDIISVSECGFDTAVIGGILISSPIRLRNLVALLSIYQSLRISIPLSSTWGYLRFLLLARSLLGVINKRDQVRFYTILIGFSTPMTGLPFLSPSPLNISIALICIIILWFLSAPLFCFGSYLVPVSIYVDFSPPPSRDD